jgi:hypothetical protein
VSAFKFETKKLVVRLVLDSAVKRDTLDSTITATITTQLSSRGRLIRKKVQSKAKAITYLQFESRLIFDLLLNFWLFLGHFGWDVVKCGGKPFHGRCSYEYIVH